MILIIKYIKQIIKSIFYVLLNRIKKCVFLNKMSISLINL